MPNFFKYIRGNHLSANSKLLLLGAVSMAYFFELDNKSILLSLLASILIGEYYTLPKNNKPIEESNKRRIGFVETAMVLQEQNAFGAGNVGGLMRIEGEIDIEKFKVTVAMLIKVHPMLRAKLDYSVEPPVLQLQDIDHMCPSIPFQYENMTDTLVSEKLEKILDIPFDHANHYLWELKLLVNQNQKGPHAMLFKAHHVICDGTSVAIFMQSLLQIYNQEKGDIKPLPFLKPAENLVKQPTNWTRVLLGHIYLQLWEMMHYKRSNLYHSYDNSSRIFSQRQTKLSFSRFEKTELECLLAACKKQDTTLTALLTAALLQAKREVLGSLEVETISTPVSVRPFFSPSTPQGNHIGCYVADTTIKIPIDSNMSLWEMAKTYKKELNALMPVIYPADFNGAAWQLKIMNDAILGDQIHFTKGVAVSNIGKANFMTKQDENTKLKLVDMYFCASLRSGGKTMQIFVDSVEDLNICFAHSEPLLNKTHADKIRENTITILKNVIQAEMKNEPANIRLNRAIS